MKELECNRLSVILTLVSYAMLAPKRLFQPDVNCLVYMTGIITGVYLKSNYNIDPISKQTNFYEQN